MRAVATLFTFVFASLSMAAPASASSACDPFRDPLQRKQLANCEAVVSRGLVPNARAFAYTVNFLVRNRVALRDPSCAVRGIDPQDRCLACRSETWVRSGIENSCSFILDDMTRRWDPSSKSKRSVGYYVDLCADDPSKLVESFYFNGGEGADYSDAPDSGPATHQWNKSRLAGAFKVEGRLYEDFTETKPEPYKKIRAQFGGIIPSIRMIGLNASNNTTESSKPIHVSAFGQGWGCPGVAPSSAEIMKKLVARGSSLFLAYGGPVYEQKGDSCQNDKSDPGHVGTGPSTGSPASQ